MQSLLKNSDGDEQEALLKEHGGKQVHLIEKNEKNIDQGPSEFVFSPPKSLEKQAQKLLGLIQRRVWNKKIQITGYKGSFKIENWITIETMLRDVRGLEAFSFVDTKLNQEHLTVLSKWLLRIIPQRLIIKLEQNELDNDDCKHFIYFLFDRNIDVQNVYIIGNPGIYKGDLISELREYLQHKYADNLEYFYQLIEDTEALSICIIKILRMATDSQTAEVIRSAQKQINKTHYYKLILKSCFTEQNWKGFQDLIMATYRKDNIEQLSYLDISDNYLGTQSAFNRMCESISSAKGLLVLKIGNQPLMNNSTTVQFLMGNRYDKLKLNEFDISNNKDILEKTYKLLSDNIFKNCQIINFSQCLPQQLSTLYKLFVMIESFAEKTAELKELYNKKKILKRGNLRVLDLSTVENYNRHDLAEKFLQSSVFNEFSGIEKLRIILEISLDVQSLDVGRCQTYIRSFQSFQEDLTQKMKEDPNFTNYKHSLKHIVFPKQSYRMEIETMKNFFLQYLFTQKGSVVEIETFDFESGTFRQVNRAEGLQTACDSIIVRTEQEEGLKFSIKKLSMTEGDYQMNMNSLKCFLFLPSVQLQEFSYSKDTIAGEWNQVFVSSCQYLDQLHPGEFLNLKVLKLVEISEITIEIHQFLELFVFHQKIRLEELELRVVSTTREETNREKLLAKIRTIKEIVSLKRLSFGQFEKIGEEDFLEFLVFNKIVRLESLKMQGFSIKDHQGTLKQILGKAHFKNTLDDLHYLELNDLKLTEKDDWMNILDIFILRQRKSLTSLSIVSMNLNEHFTLPLNFLLLPFIQEIKTKYENSIKDTESAINQQLKVDGITANPFALEQLRIEKCELTDDFLSGFLVVGELTNVSIISCETLCQSIPKSIEIITAQSLANLSAYKIKSFSCEGSEIKNKATFQQLICDIVLNTNQYQLQSLNLSKCALSDEMIELLAEQIIKIKELYANRTFSLRDINLSNNNQISANVWSKLWNVLLNKNQFEQESANYIDQSQIANTLEKQSEVLAEETAALIKTQNFNLKEKVLNHYKIFTPKFPQQLLHLQMRMDFTFLNVGEQKNEYFRIIVGYILHPESQLKELELDFLNLVIFIKACLEAQEFSQLYLQDALHQPTVAPKSQIKSIKLTNVKEVDVESIENFLQMFLCSNDIELNKLTIAGCKQPIIKPLLDNMKRRDNYVLEELHLPDIEETLQQDQAEQFLSQILFGEKMPIKTVTCSPKFENLLIEQLQQIDCGQNKITQLKIKYEDDQESAKFYSLILEKLAISNLQELEIETKDATQLFCNLSEKLPIEKVSLQKITINGEITLSKKQFQFLGQMLEKLQLLKITTLGLNKEDEIYEACQQMVYKGQNRCKLDIGKIKCNSVQEACKKIIFNPNVGFTDLVFRQSDLFANIKIHDLKQNIRYLNLTMGLLYNSNVQLNENALTIIGETLIYNEESQLEELILHQCHLKEAGIQALVKAATVFKENVAIEGRQSKAQLALRRLTIYYSLYIGNDGADKINKNIFYFEYINIERIEVLVTNWNDSMTMSLCKSAQNWLIFQQQHNRKYQELYPLKYLDLGRNEFVDNYESWSEMLKTFIFTHNTPYLETFNIHFMAINDLKSSYIVNEALQFFEKQPPHYIFQVKKMNFSQNNSLTHIGWENLFKNFLFHPKVHLEELNMISTMLDSKIKLEVIAKVIQERALKSPNKKVPLHTFLCYNISLKDSIYEYLSEQPANYQLPVELPVEIEYQDSRNIGNFDGVPESYGEILQIFQRTFELRNSMVYKKDWKLTRYKFSPYHLNICDNYLKILNQHYQDQGQTQVTINLSLQTLDLMASYFRYIIDYPGEPYPYNLLFQQQCFDYFKSRESRITTIKVLQIEFSELEQLNQFQVLRLWENLKNMKNSRSSINQIQVEYYLNDDLIEDMFKNGYDESDIISLIRIIPPSKIRIQNSLSIQALKAIYSIMYDTYYFQFSLVSYSFDDFLNIGVGYSLREVFYNYQANGTFKRLLKNFFYNFFNFFIKPTRKYLYNEEVKALTKYLSEEKVNFYTIALLNVLFIISAIRCSQYYAETFNSEIEQQPNQQYMLSSQQQAENVFKKFSVVTAVVETIIYLRIAKFMPSHLNSGAKLKAFLFSFISLIFSQLNKLGLFNEMIFICNCYYSNEFMTFLLAVFITFISQSLVLFEQSQIIYVRIMGKKQDAQEITSRYINDFSRTSFLGRNLALAALLDQAAPFNAVVIPNTNLGQSIFPHHAGKAVNNLIRSYFQQLILEDLPIMILQLYFVMSQLFKRSDELPSSILFSLGFAIFTAFFSFYKLLSIRPTNLLQEDFDHLQNQQQKIYKATLNQNLVQEKQQIETFTKLFHKEPLQNVEEQIIEEKEQLLK